MAKKVRQNKMGAVRALLLSLGLASGLQLPRRFVANGIAAVCVSGGGARVALARDDQLLRLGEQAPASAEIECIGEWPMIYTLADSIYRDVGLENTLSSPNRRARGRDGTLQTRETRLC